MEATVVVKPVRAHFLLEGSEQQRESSSRALYSSLREHGYALLDFSTGVTADASYLPPTIGGCIEPVKKFFAKSEGEKGCYVEKLVEDRLKGYFPHNQKGPSGKGRPEHYILWLKEEEDSSNSSKKKKKKAPCPPPSREPVKGLADHHAFILRNAAPPELCDLLVRSAEFVGFEEAGEGGNQQGGGEQQQQQQQQQEEEEEEQQEEDETA